MNSEFGMRNAELYFHPPIAASLLFRQPADVFAHPTAYGTDSPFRIPNSAFRIKKGTAEAIPSFAFD